MAIDKVGINLFHFPKKRLAFEFIIFHGKEVLFVNLALFYDGAAFSYLSVLPCDFFLGAYPFACFIIEHAACGSLDVRLRKQFSFAEDKVDMIVCLAFVVVEGLHALHAIPPAELLRKIFNDFLRLVSYIYFRQGDNQFPCFNTLALCTASLKFLLAFPCKVTPKFIVGGAVGGIEIFLSCVACDIGYSSLDIG